MVTDSSSPAALALPLPAHAHTAARELARVHGVSLRAVLLAASMYAGQETGLEGRRPLDKGRLVRDAETFLSHAGFGTSHLQRYTSDSGDILIRVAEDPVRHTFRVELTPLSARIPADRQWRLWNRFVTFLQAPRSDLTALARMLATRSPDTVAIEDDHDRFTYRDLAHLADNAAALSTPDTPDTLGAPGPGSVIGVLGSAGARFWATVFALYDAGLTYVPLDTRHPAQRLQSMARTAGCTLIVDTTASADLPRSARSPLATSLKAVARVVSWKHLNELRPATHAASDTERRREPSPEDVACIMFTGETGATPRGVQVPRGALAHLATWAAAEMGLARGTIVSQGAAVGVDAAAWEVWPALFAGAPVLVAPDDVRDDPAAFVGWLLSRNVEVALAPAPIAELLIGMTWPTGTDLRVLASGGEQLAPIPPGLPFRVLGLYGPTECTVVSAAAWVEPGDRTPPIGHVVPHLYHRVVDDNGTPVAPGTPGELWLGGPGLALGYAGLPNETAERFIPDPHAASAQRVFRTGDLVRERPDGQLDFLGRRGARQDRHDGPVKVAGARVEHDIEHDVEQGGAEVGGGRIPGVRSAAPSTESVR
ncbi:AMP-binding protein [Catenulispora rubra]|uniref:AMP-binding protein n=1 Tax=Catenulispora rubra TaxID=280293 RepID=UPI00189268F7|nr:AMP-binding protein [Catenulispora rubra]